MEELTKILTDRFVGKRIECPFPARDRQGKVIPNKFTTIVGQCSFAGYNTCLDCFQVTVNRCPVTFNNVKDFEKINIV